MSAILTSTPLPRSFGWRRWYVAVLFYALPFADAATGYLVLSGSFAEAEVGSVSQLIRALLLAAALWMLRGAELLVALTAMLYLLALECVVLILHQQPSWFLVGVVYDFKPVYLLVAYLVLREAQRRDGIDVTAYFVHGATIYGAILVLSTLGGFHTATYHEESFGTKGVFASGNALSLYLGCAALLALDRGRRDGARWSAAEGAFLIVCCVLVGTKASIAFGAMFVVLALQGARLVWQLPALAGVLALVGLYAAELAAAFKLVFDVIVFRFEMSESLLAFMASGRQDYVADALTEFDTSGWAVLRLLFGMGSFVSFRDPLGLLVEYDTLESDVFDIFFAYGLLGLGTYVALVLQGLRLAWKAHRPHLLLAWLGVSLYSVLAGHVVFNGMSGMALAVIPIALQAAAREPRRHG